MTPGIRIGVALRATEALLEAIYLRPLTNLVAEIHGKRVLQVIKPSQQREAFLGFDAGWARVPDVDGDLEQKLRDFIKDPTQPQPMYLGYFLQFKVAKVMKNKTRTMPAGFTTPYHRAELSTTANLEVGLSQHQVLLSLSTAKRTSVQYCVPEVFDADHLYEAPDLDKLRFFDVSEAPEYTDNFKHHLCFMPGSDDGKWCSTPVDGPSTGAAAWAQGLEVMSASDLLAMLNAVNSLARDAGSDSDAENLGLRWTFLRTLTLVEVGEFGTQEGELA